MRAGAYVCTLRFPGGVQTLAYILVQIVERPIRETYLMDALYQSTHQIRSQTPNGPKMAMTIRGRESTFDATFFKENRLFSKLSDRIAESSVGLGARIVPKLALDADIQLILRLSSLQAFFVPFGGDDGAPMWAVHNFGAKLQSDLDFMPHMRLFSVPITATYAQWLAAIGEHLDSRPREAKEKTNADQS